MKKILENEWWPIPLLSLVLLAILLVYVYFHNKAKKKREYQALDQDDIEFVSRASSHLDSNESGIKPEAKQESPIFEPEKKKVEEEYITVLKEIGQEEDEKEVMRRYYIEMGEELPPELR